MKAEQEDYAVTYSFDELGEENEERGQIEKSEQIHTFKAKNLVDVANQEYKDQVSSFFIINKEIAIMPHLPLPGASPSVSWKNIAKDVISPFKPKLPILLQEIVANLDKKKKNFRTSSTGGGLESFQSSSFRRKKLNKASNSGEGPPLGSPHLTPVKRNLLTSRSINMENFRANSNARNAAIKLNEVSFISEKRLSGRENWQDAAFLKQGVRRRSCNCLQCGELTLKEKKTASLPFMTKVVHRRNQKLKSLLKLKKEQRTSLLTKTHTIKVEKVMSAVLKRPMMRQSSFGTVGLNQEFESPELKRMINDNVIKSATLLTQKMIIKNQMDDIKREIAKRKGLQAKKEKGNIPPFLKVGEKENSPRSKRPTWEPSKNFSHVFRVPKYTKFISKLESLKISSAREIRPLSLQEELKSEPAQKESATRLGSPLPNQKYHRPYINTYCPELYHLLKTRVKFDEKPLSAQQASSKAGFIETHTSNMNQSSVMKYSGYIPEILKGQSNLNESGVSSRASTGNQLVGISRRKKKEPSSGSTHHRRIQSQGIGKVAEGL